MSSKRIILCILAIFVLSLQFSEKPLISQETSNVIISFDFNKTRLSGSNQFAVWVSDKDGKFIKTLYVTKFSGFGGYNKRPDALPVWSKNHIEVGLDSVTKPTPSTSKVTCYWDFTDASGKSLPRDAEYIINIEATTHLKNNVLYTAIINPGTTREISVHAKYSNSEAKESNMISNVKVSL